MKRSSYGILIRIVYGIGLIFAVFLFPSWVTMILAFAPLWYLKQYPEFIIIALLLDFTYQVPNIAGDIFSGGVFYALISVVLYFLTLGIKQHLFLYR